MYKLGVFWDRTFIKTAIAELNIESPDIFLDVVEKFSHNVLKNKYYNRNFELKNRYQWYKAKRQITDILIHNLALVKNFSKKWNSLIDKNNGKLHNQRQGTPLNNDENANFVIEDNVIYNTNEIILDEIQSEEAMKNMIDRITMELDSLTISSFTISESAELINDEGIDIVDLIDRTLTYDRENTIADVVLKNNLNAYNSNIQNLLHTQPTGSLNQRFLVLEMNELFKFEGEKVAIYITLVPSP